MVKRYSSLEIDPELFKTLGHRLTDQIAGFLSTIRTRPVTRGESPEEIRKILGNSSLPEKGRDVSTLLDDAAQLMLEHSLLNGHPGFFGYITSSAAPIGALSEFLTAAVNPNVALFHLAPIATEIEAQTVRWIAELIGYPTECGGLLVSGGNMANFVCFLAARKASADWDIRSLGLRREPLRIYTSKETHTWIEKAADMFGLGTQAIRWIATDKNLRMDAGDLEEQISKDSKAGDQPFLVIGTAGTTGTGAIDPIREISRICKDNKLWLHVDGAYGALAASLPDADEDLRSLELADSVAVDPHKWLYAPLEAGCALVRRPEFLTDAFSFHPPYYRLQDDGEKPPLNYFEYGPQNSRGFRALKVWMSLLSAGREGLVGMISDDIALAEELYRAVARHSELQAFTRGLSIATFRYVPSEIRPGPDNDGLLNELNERTLARIQKEGRVFLSNAVIDGKFLLRACIVNFRTTSREIAELPEIVAGAGRMVFEEMRPAPVS